MTDPVVHHDVEHHMQDDGSPTRGRVKRFLLAYEGVVTVIMIALAVWAARGCYDDRMADIEELPSTVTAMNTRFETAEARLATLELRGSLGPEERSVINIRLQRVEFMVGQMFCLEAPSREIQRFARIDCDAPLPAWPATP